MREGRVPADGMRIAAKVWGTAEGGEHRLGYTEGGSTVAEKGGSTDALTGVAQRPWVGDNRGGRRTLIHREEAHRGRGMGNRCAKRGTSTAAKGTSTAKGTTRLRLLPKGKGVPQHDCACIPQVKAYHNTAAPEPYR